LSGDCTSALATVAGLQRRGLAPGVLWLDAHADFHTPRTTRSGDLDRMALAMLVGRAGATLRDASGMRPLPEEEVVLAGARAVDEAEREALESSPLRRLALATLADAPLPAPPWYVHLDVAVLDPGELPALRDPAPGGPSALDVASALRTLAARGAIPALGVACTFTTRALAERDPLAAIRPLIEAALGV
jgi:arginase